MSEATPPPTGAPPPPRKRPSGLALRLGTLSQALHMLRANDRRWLLPMMVLLLLLGMILSGLQAIQYLAPFIYAIF